jgi:hypothetical protein
MITFAEKNSYGIAISIFTFFRRQAGGLLPSVAGEHG